MGTFKVESSNPSNNGTTHVSKLVRETTVDLGILGKKVKKETFYISAPNQLEKDSEIDLDMDLFRVEEYPYTFEDDNNEEVTIMCKWLHLA